MRPVGMGTGLLARRMKPEVAQVEKRGDLSAAYVERAARVPRVLNMRADHPRRCVGRCSWH